MGWRELILPWQQARAYRDRAAMLNDVLVKVLEQQKAERVAAQDLEDDLAAVTERNLELTRDLAARSVALTQANHDARHFETEFIRMELRAKAAEERADYWHGIASARTPDDLGRENLARLAAQMNAEPDEAETAEPVVPRGFIDRFNEVFMGGWRPPISTDTVPNEEPLTDGDGE